MNSDSPHDIRIPLGIRMHCRHGLHITFPPSSEPFHLKVAAATRNRVVVFDSTLPVVENKPREFQSVQVYNVPWEVTITRQDGHTLFTYVTTLSGQPACVRLDSGRLADLIPWAAACITFQRQHNCRLTVMVPTAVADFLSKGFPDLHIITETDFHEKDYFATYTVGHSAEATESPQPYDANAPLQNIVRILGLRQPYQQPQLAMPPLPPEAVAARERTVCLAISGKDTAWEKPVSQAVKLLRQQGFTVVRVSLQDGLQKCAAAMAASSLVLTDTPDASWLGAALNVPVVRITGAADDAWLHGNETHLTTRLPGEGHDAGSILQALLLVPSFRATWMKTRPLAHTIRFSVLVPAYNGEKMLGACLDSILRQSYPDFELVVLDDGSTDGTAELLRRIAARDSRVRILTQEVNQGRVVARQRLIAEAKEEFIIWSDHDDTLAPDYLETAAQLLEGLPPCDILFFPVHMESPMGTRRDIGVRPRLDIARDQLATYLGNESLSGTLWAKVFRRPILQDISTKGHENLSLDDVFFTPDIFSRARRILFVPTAHGMYNYAMDTGEWSSRIHHLTPENLQQTCRLRHEQCVFMDGFLRSRGMEKHLPHYVENFTELGILLNAIAHHPEKEKLCDIFQQWFCKSPDCLLNDGKVTLPDYAQRLYAMLDAIRKA